MKNSRLFPVIALLCAATSLGARADDQTEIKQLYTRLSAAMKARKVDAVQALCTPDFKEIRINGKEIAGKAAEQMLQDQFAMMTRVDDATVRPDSITITGTKAVVWTSYSMKAEVTDKLGKLGPKGAKHVMADVGKTRDTLIKTPKGWRFQQTKTLKQAPTIDGHSTYQMGPPRGRR